MRSRTVHVKTGAIAASSSVSATIAIGTRMLIHWSDIAIEQERLARAARRVLEAEVEEAKATGKGLDTTRELRPSLIAIAAASHALDALCGELRDLTLPAETAEKWRSDPRSAPARPVKLRETLKHGFDIPAPQWEPQLENLFDLRDAAVHPALVFGESVPHPLGVNTAAEYVKYNSEKATEAVDLLIEILETCAERPKPVLKAWASDLAPSLQRLKLARSKIEL